MTESPFCLTYNFEEESPYDDVTGYLTSTPLVKGSHEIPSPRARPLDPSLVVKLLPLLTRSM